VVIGVHRNFLYNFVCVGEWDCGGNQGEQGGIEVLNSGMASETRILYEGISTKVKIL